MLCKSIWLKKKEDHYVLHCIQQHCTYTNLITIPTNKQQFITCGMFYSVWQKCNSIS